MKENLHIDEAARQEVEKGNFPYQEAHWEALAAQLPGHRKGFVWWPWLLGVVLLSGVGLALWQPWSKTDLKRNFSYVQPVSGEITIEHADISFVASKAGANLISPPIIQIEKPDRFVEKENAPVIDSLSEVPSVSIASQKIQIDAIIVPSLRRSFDSIPRKIKLFAIPACETPTRFWSLSLWATPILAGRTLIDELQNPNSAPVIRVLDSLEGNRLGMSYGIQIHRNLNKRLGMNVGINWVDLGYDFKDSLTFFPPDPGNPTSISYVYKHRYIQAEFGANYLMKRQKPALYGSFSLAPAWKIDFKRKQTLYYENQDPEVKIDDFSFAEFRSFNLYGKAGLGLMWPGNAKVNVMLEPSFTYGIIPLARNAEYNRALWGWQVRSGIVIRL